MPNINSTFTVCGITTDTNGDSKVRWTQDLVRRTKLFAKQGYVRVDLVELPHPMNKLDALAHIAALPQFTNPGDAMTIADATAYREVAKAKADGTYTPRKRGRPRKNPAATVVVKKTRGSRAKTAISMEGLKSRARSVDREVAAVLSAAGIEV